jgi:hypothetical protein
VLRQDDNKKWVVVERYQCHACVMQASANINSVISITPTSAATTMPAAKRQKITGDNEIVGQHDSGALKDDSAEDHSVSEDGSEGDSGSDGEESSQDTENEIAAAKWTKSKKTLKRKRRATEPSHFGATLQSLLNTDAPSALPLSLKPGVARKRNDAQLESKARKALQIEKKEKEDNRRIRDVIGGWGGESERALRKVAQRGGTHLYSALWPLS